MTTDIAIPSDLWEEDVDAVITNWLASDGAQVSEGDLVAEIMVEKVQHEIRAPASGTLSIARDVDEIVKKRDVIGSVS